ncbi:MAG: TraB/GumN family protein [Steroidobacteraceae bacterium]
MRRSGGAGEFEGRDGRELLATARTPKRSFPGRVAVVYPGVRIGALDFLSRLAVSGANLLIFVALAASSLAAPARAAAANHPDSQDSLPEILVTGERPGPGLWKVTNGPHVLWILGTLSPLPKDMTWRSREVEDILARASEVIEPASVSARLGLFRTLRYLPSLLRARYNPNGRTLKDVLPPDLYARWAVLKSRYIGDDRRVERLRPMFAAAQLYERALARSSLTTDDAVRGAVRRLARRHRVRVTDPLVQLEIRDPKRVIGEFAQTPLDAELACLSTTMERLENDLGNMTLRANAWAIGDIETLQRLRPPLEDGVCVDAFTSAPGLKEQFARLTEEARNEWLRQIKAALAGHAVTLAVLPIADLLATNGRLAQLRAQGYSVEPPRELGTSGGTGTFHPR